MYVIEAVPDNDYAASVVGAFIFRCIEGPAGMNSFEEHEMVIWHVSDRVAAADYIIRCLANPDCEGSQMVLDAILARRHERMEAAQCFNPHPTF